MGFSHLGLVVILVHGDLPTHVLVPELPDLTDGEVLAVSKEGMAGVLPQQVGGQLVGLVG